MVRTAAPPPLLWARASDVQEAAGSPEGQSWKGLGVTTQVHAPVRSWVSGERPGGREGLLGLWGQK